MQYLCYQQEIAPVTKRPHWQGYCELKGQLGLNRIKEIFSNPCLHVERRRGTQLEAIEYCRKTESAVPYTFFEFGEKKAQGERTDWETLKEAIKKYSSFNTILDLVPHLAIRYFFQVKGVQKCLLEPDNIERTLLKSEEFKKKYWNAHNKHSMTRKLGNTTPTSSNIDSENTDPNYPYITEEPKNIVRKSSHKIEYE